MILANFSAYIVAYDLVSGTRSERLIEEGCFFDVVLALTTSFDRDMFYQGNYPTCRATTCFTVSKSVKT